MSASSDSPAVPGRFARVRLDLVAMGAALLVLALAFAAIVLLLRYGFDVSVSTA